MQAIDRTFKILELFLEDNYELNISEMAKLSGLSSSVTHRIVISLQKKGYLMQKEKKGKYSLGLKFLNYAYMTRRNMKTDMIMPFLKKLNKATNEAVMLANADQDQLLVIERVDTNHALRVSTGPIGKDAFLHCTAIGKLFLSGMSDIEKKSLYKNKALKKYTEYTITDMKKLEKEFELFKTEGCMYEKDEYILGIWSVAAPVYGPSGRIEAGLTIHVPTARITPEKVRNYTKLVKLYASKISAVMGYGLKEK